MTSIHFRIDADKKLVLEYIAARKVGVTRSDVIRATLNDSIDFDALLPEAKKFFANGGQLVTTNGTEAE